MRDCGCIKSTKSNWYDCDYVEIDPSKFPPFEIIKIADRLESITQQDNDNSTEKRPVDYFMEST